MTEYEQGSLPRRDFLKALSVGGLAAGLSSLQCRTPNGGEVTSPHGLVVRKASPYNAEPSPDDLLQDWLTPTERFFVRTHAPVPRVDPSRYRLTVSGRVDRPLSLSLEQLRNDYPLVETTCIVQCAGNRRDEFARIERVGGVQWTLGAIGNARWRGVRLGDILDRAGARSDASHVWFTGLDECEVTEGTTPFGASIPIEKARSEESLVALEMNGRPLTPEHGFPTRALIPGFIGARSVKWLDSITVSDRPSDNHYLARAYKIFPADVTQHTVDWESAPPLHVLPINSAIMNVEQGEQVPAGSLDLRGYASATGVPGCTVSSVEVSADGGESWTEADITSTVQPYTWCFWRASVPVRPGPAVLAVRARDTIGSAQPEVFPWNFKGYGNNGWHRVSVVGV